MSATRINVRRILRIATFSLAMLAGILVSFAYQPTVDGLESRLDDDQARLRSDDIAFSEMPRLRSERAEFAARYGVFGRTGQAMFLRQLASTVRRHSVTLVSTAVTEDTGTTESATRPTLFQTTRVLLGLRGRYHGLLAAIGELSLGTNIVGVSAPTLRRDGEAILASVPVTLYQPVDEGTP